MNSVSPSTESPTQPSGWRQALLRALSDPALAAFDGAEPAASDQADWAAYAAAVALGRCRLFGVELGADDGSLVPAMGLAAARKWRVFLEEWTRSASEIPERWKRTEGNLQLLDIAIDPLEERMDCWAAFVAIDEAYEEAVESGWERRQEFGGVIDEGLAALDRFDGMLHEQIEYLAAASRTALLDNWRKMLTGEYSVALPWWLDGKLEELDLEIAEGATAWQPRQLPLEPLGANQGASNRISLLEDSLERKPPMSAPNPLTHQFFFKTALEYYIDGRAACLSGCLFTTGNLFHHAVEFILKGELSRTMSLDDLRDKFGHWLPKCWAAFKALFPSEDLTEFDPMVSELDKFERIRYPDHILAHGAGIGFGFGRWQPADAGIDNVPQYTMGIGFVDAFFSRVIRLCHMNPQAYFSFLTAEGREILLKYNEEAQDWLS